MKIHPLIGAEILGHVNFPYPVVPIVEAHHERWDGAGYPFGKKGEEIPIGARILAVVDCLDALCSERQYRRALPVTEALEQVVTLAGTQFDPKVVAALKQNCQRLRELNASAPGEGSYFHCRRSRSLCGEGRYENAMQTDGNFLTSIAAARQEAQMLYEISHDLGNSLSLDETLSLLSVRLRRLVPYDSIVVYVKSENELLPQHIAGDHFRVLSSLSLQVGQGLSGWVAEKGTPILNGNPALEFASIHRPKPCSGADIRRIGAPQQSQRDHWRAYAVPCGCGGIQPGQPADFAGNQLKSCSFGGKCAAIPASRELGDYRLPDRAAQCAIAVCASWTRKSRAANAKATRWQSWFVIWMDLS